MAKSPSQQKGRAKKTVPVTRVKKASLQSGSVADWISSKGALLLLVLSGVIFLWTRIHLLAIPLERDEGSFAYIGHWLLRGRELYTDMLDSKLPGLYAIYGLTTSLFGLTATGVHMSLLIANGVAALCFYKLVKGLYSPYIAALATSLYLILIISPNVVGFAAHATQLLMPFVLAGFLFFWKGIRSGQTLMFFWAGLVIGMAFAIKQQAAIFGLLLAVLWWPIRLRWIKRENQGLPVLEWVMMGVGGFLPLAVIVGYFAMVGRLDEFYNWSILQPIHLAGSFEQSRTSMFMTIFPQIVKKQEALWLLSGLGLVLIFFLRKGMEARVFGAMMGLTGFLSVAIGAAYYQHYFVPALAGVALLAAVTIQVVAGRFGKTGLVTGLVLCAGLIIWSMAGRTSYFFQPDYAAIHYENYNQNMFPELEKIGKELARRVPEGQRIGIMGSEPEVLVAAGRESCSRHLMVYSLLSDPVLSPPMQQEYIREMQACMPEYIVWNTVSGSWTRGYEQLQFFKQLRQWVEANYLPIGLAESRKDKPGVIVWDEALASYTSQTDYKVVVFRRNPQR